MDVKLHVILVLMVLCVRDVIDGDRCKTIGALESIDVTYFKLLYPLGPDQCEKACLSDIDCQVMAYHVKHLACYMGSNKSGQSNLGGKDFVVKLRTDIQNDRGDPCASQQCAVDHGCVTVKSDAPVCLPRTYICDGTSPISVKFSTVTHDNRSAKYTCDSGRYSIAENVSKCNANLQWTVPDVVCCPEAGEYVYDPSTNINVNVPPLKLSKNNGEKCCKHQGAVLAEIRTVEQLNAMCSVVGAVLYSRYSIGATDTETAGTFLFPDGGGIDNELRQASIFDYRSDTTKRCLMIHVVSPYQCYIRNDSCDGATRFYICEIK